MPMTVKPRPRQYAALAVLIAGLAVCVALAPAATTVRVTQPDGDDRRIDIANVRGDVGPNEEYVVNGEPYLVTGVSLGRLLDRARVPLGSWVSVRVGSFSLTDDEYERFGDETPPAFFDDQGDATFIVPDRGSDTGRIVSGGLSVRASGYSVEITPDDAKIDAGDSLRFRPKVTPGPAAGLDFRWDRNRTDFRSGRSVTYRFPDKGRETVSVRVARQGTPVATDSTTVNVDRKPKDDEGTDGDDDGSSTGTGGVGYSDTTTPDSTTPSYTPPAYDPPSATPTPSTPSPSPEATPDDSDPAAVPDQLAEVAGDLLADTTPIPPAGSTGDPAAASPEETADDDPELAISGAVVVAGLAAVLLGLGAGWELERIRPRRWLRRPDLSGLRRLLPRLWL